MNTNNIYSYAFVNGKISELENTFFSKPDLERLLKNNITLFNKTLKESFYGAFEGDGKNLLNNASKENDNFLLKYLKDNNLKQAILIENDLHNVKYLIREGKNKDVYKKGFFSKELWEKVIIKGENPKEIPQRLRHLTQKAYLTFYKTKDGFELDKVVERGFNQYRLDIIKGYNFYRKFLSIDIDINNLLTIFRTIDNQWDRYYFIDGGTVNTRDIDIKDKKRTNELFSEYKEIIDATTALTREMKGISYKLRFLKKASLYVFNYPRLLAYYLRRKEEIRLLLRIYITLKTNVSTEKEVIVETF